MDTSNDKQINLPNLPFKLPVKVVYDNPYFWDYSVIDAAETVIRLPIAANINDVNKRAIEKERSERIAEAINQYYGNNFCEEPKQEKKKLGNPAFVKGQSNPYKK